MSATGACEVNFPCSRCTNGVFWAWNPQQQSERVQVPCSRCANNVDIDLSRSPGLARGERVDSCLHCGCREFYVQKDFSRFVGVLVVIICCAAAPFTYFLSLVLLSALDFFLFRRLPLVTVCYGCEAVYRGPPVSSEHRGFELVIRDRYRFGKEVTP